MELLSFMLGTLAGILATVWRPDSEGYMERFLKAVLPIILVVMSMALIPCVK